MTQEKRNTSDTKNVLGWLWQVSGIYKICVMILFVVQVTFGVCGVVSAMLFRTLIDHAVEGQADAFFQAAICLAGLFLGEDLCFVLEYLSFCDNAIVVPYNNYLYRYENQQNKFPMNYQQFSIHCIAFMNSMHRFEVHTGCKFPKIYSSIIRSFFYHYYTYLKKCKTYRFYVEQSRLIKQFDIDKIRYALREESFLKRCYLYIMIGIPCIGYFVNRFK